MNGHANGSSPRDELVSKGVGEKVADKFQEIFQSGKLKSLQHSFLNFLKFYK